jgi:hypothetical protein
MTQQAQTQGFVWVVVQEPGGNEVFLGQYDSKNDISFIPVFSTREEALQALGQMARDPKKKYEAQAIHRDQITQHGLANGFVIFRLNEQGQILEKILPKT